VKYLNDEYYINVGNAVVWVGLIDEACRDKCCKILTAFVTAKAPWCKILTTFVTAKTPFVK